MAHCSFCQRVADDPNQIVRLETIVAVNLDEKHTEISIREMISYATEMKFNTDDFIFGICMLCISHAEIAYKFKMQCIHAQQISLIQQNLAIENNQTFIGYEESYQPIQEQETTELLHIPENSECFQSSSEHPEINPGDIIEDFTTEVQDVIDFEDIIKTHISVNESYVDFNDLEDLNSKDDHNEVKNEEKETMPTNYKVVLLNGEALLVPEEDPIKTVLNFDGQTNTIKTKPPVICKMCDKSFQRSCDLKYHMLRHQNKRQYHCVYCQKSFNTLSGRRAHINRIHKNANFKKTKVFFKCRRCDFTCKSRQEMTAHLNSKHFDGKIFECTVCTKRYKSKENLRSHARLHDENFYSNCKICGLRKSRRAMYLHIKYVHNDTQAKCKECNRTFANAKALASHIGYKHTVKEPRFACTLCDKKFRYESKLQLHLIVHENKGEHTCPYCIYTTNSKQGLSSHVRLSHPEIKPQKCSYDVCEFAAQRQEKLHEHVASAHHQEKHIACTVCDYRTHTRRLLTIHMQAKHEPKQFKCTQCDKEYASAPNLRLHMGSVHSEDETKWKYRCEECKRNFSSSTSIKRHNDAAHLNARRFQCEYCPRSFFTAFSRQQHHAVFHKEEATFICEFCGDKFKTAAALRCHVKRLHGSQSINGKRNFECEICNNRFAKKDRLLTHIKTVHKDENYEKILITFNEIEN